MYKKLSNKKKELIVNRSRHMLLSNTLSNYRERSERNQIRKIFIFEFFKRVKIFKNLPVNFTRTIIFITTNNFLILI